jgi:hypothetical protein
MPARAVPGAPVGSTVAMSLEEVDLRREGELVIDWNGDGGDDFDDGDDAEDLRETSRGRERRSSCCCCCCCFLRSSRRGIVLSCAGERKKKRSKVCRRKGAEREVGDHLLVGELVAVGALDDA